jgi:hypothetical protein
MKIIKKENAVICYLPKYEASIYYCFNNNVEYDTGAFVLSDFNGNKLLTDITVDDEDRIHSFDDKAGFSWSIRRFRKNIFTFLWFQHGLIKRENPEKSYKVVKNDYYFCEGLDRITMATVLRNLKLIKNK